MVPDFVKYPRIPHLYEASDLLDNPVSVFEKMDGGNSQIRKSEGRIFTGSRARFLSERRDKNAWFPNFLSFVMKNPTFYNLPENLIIFTEWLSQHTLDYTPQSRNQAYLLDVYDTKEMRFLPYQEGLELLTSLGIKGVNFLKPIFSNRKVGVSELKEVLLDRDSDYRNPGKKMEGVVLKDYSSQRFAKFWRRSAMKRVDYIDEDDLRRAVFGLVDEDKPIRYDLVLGKIEENLYEEQRGVDEEIIETFLKMFFDDSGQLKKNRLK